MERVRWKLIFNCLQKITTLLLSHFATKKTFEGVVFSLSGLESSSAYSMRRAEAAAKTRSSALPAQ